MILLHLELDPGDGSPHLVDVPLHEGYGSVPVLVHELIGLIIRCVEGDTVWLMDSQARLIPVWRPAIRAFSTMAR